MSAVPLLILSYHDVSPTPGPLTIAPETFQSQIERLTSAGLVFRTISDGLERAGRAECGAVAVTFDDGFVGVLQHAAPALQKAGAPATLFPILGALGATTRWCEGGSELPPLAVCTTEQIRELVGQGWEIGSHGRSHRCLLGLSPSELQNELAAKHELALAVESDVRGLAYPQGCFNSRTIEATAAEGYEWAVTTVPIALSSRSARLFALPRVSIGPETTPRRFDLALRHWAREMKAILAWNSCGPHRSHRHSPERNAWSFDQPTT